MAARSVISIAVSVGIFSAVAAGAPVNAAEIKVQSTVGVKTVVEELAPKFERETGHKLTIVFGVSNIMKRDIAAGVPFDLAIMTAPVADELIEQGKLVAATRTDVARGGIGIAVRAGAPKPDIGSVEALKGAVLNAKSIAYSKEGASGIYFAGLLERLGIAEAVRPKTVYGTSNVGDLVAAGEAELGVNMITELLPVRGLEVVGPLPPEVQSYVVLTAGVATQAKEPGAAAAFLRFLTAPAAASVYTSRGLEPGPNF
jgi:molybdate transport system substrate-binding protein